MKRAVLCVRDPHNYLDQLNNYSVMIVNPDAVESRQKYLLDHSDWSLLVRESGEEYRDGNDYGDERLFWYTSGTTGDSKFCSFTQAQLDLKLKQMQDAYQFTANDRYTGIMPLWHAHGQTFFWLSRRVGFEAHFITAKDLRHMPEHAPTFITAIPDVLRTILNLNFEHLRFVRSASAPMNNDLYQALQSCFQVPVLESFGMTETLSHCFTNPLHGEQRIGTVGLPDGVEADIREGHLWLRGATICHTGWFDTGDLADQDSAGYYRILGRSKDQINIRGVKINPASLERQLLATVPAVGNCAIFGSDTVKCLYTGDVDPAVIRDFLTSLGSYCRPLVLQKIDAIPVSPPIGKVSRSWLNERY
jgi:long-subunit acyl-CoA synthetase (AMP-forming)